MKPLLCFAHGRDNEWEAICLDLDIAVQGRSYQEVYGLLSEAIQTYVEDAQSEDPDTAIRLLSRQAPLLVRLRYMWDFLWSAVKARDAEARHGFTMPCAA